MLEKFTFITLPLYPVPVFINSDHFSYVSLWTKQYYIPSYGYSLQFLVLSTIDKFLSPKKTGEEELPKIKKYLPDNLEKKYLLLIYWIESSIDFKSDLERERETRVPIDWLYKVQ